MKYAIVQSGGKQYKVSEGLTVTVENLKAEPGSDVNFDKILFLAADGVFHVGKPVLNNIAVTGKVLEKVKGTKIRVMKYKAKSRYRRVTGHRQVLSKVQISKITAKEGKKETK